jgi:hypothetical protein
MRSLFAIVPLALFLGSTIFSYAYAISPSVQERGIVLAEAQGAPSEAQQKGQEVKESKKEAKAKGKKAKKHQKHEEKAGAPVTDSGK